MSVVVTDKFQGSALELARCAKGYEFEDLERETGIDRKLCAKIEVGSRYPTDIEINKLAESLDVLPHFFNKAWIKPPKHSYNIKLTGA